MNHSTAPHDAAERLRYVFHRLARCPVCNSTDVVATRGKVANGDGTATRPTQCRGCGHKFDLILE